MENWLKECNLEVNEDKTEYMVIGSRIQQRFWTTNGKMIRSRSSVNYLGYSRMTED